MDYDEKIKYMLADLTKKGLSKSTLIPPVYHLLWAFGLKPAPPIFWNFFKQMFWSSTGVIALVLFGFYFIEQESLQKSLMLALILGPTFGLIISCYYMAKAKSLKLPPWSKYPLIKKESSKSKTAA